MLTQIILNTTELATWFIGAVITAMCILLYNLLKKLESHQEKHRDKLEQHGLTLVKHGEQIETLEDKIK